MTPAKSVPDLPGEEGDPIDPIAVLIAYVELVKIKGEDGVKLHELQDAVRDCAP